MKNYQEQILFNLKGKPTINTFLSHTALKVIQSVGLLMGKVKRLYRDDAAELSYDKKEQLVELIENAISHLAIMLTLIKTDNYKEKGNLQHLEESTFFLLNIAEETGEVVEQCLVGDSKEISKEIGDVLWPVVQLATTFELDIDYILSENIIKIEDRIKRNVVKGSGNNR